MATGKYAGEGFDEPRLDTLFLAMPISWSGTLSQYVGRPHCEYEGKTEVKIYDYIDINVRMLENMYKKRLSGYSRLGYAPEDTAESDFRTIYTDNCEADLFRDICNAGKSVITACSYIPAKQLGILVRNAKSCMQNGVQFLFVTRNSVSAYQSRMLGILTAHSIKYTVKNSLPHSFTVIDSRIVWYSGGELF